VSARKKGKREGQLILWIDTETTGLDADRHALVQLACIVDDPDGNAIDEFEIFARPFRGAKISPESVEKTGWGSREFVRDPRFVPPQTAFLDLLSRLERHVNRYDHGDKFVIAGKNVGFDVRFLRAFFLRNDDPYYGSWFHPMTIDLDTDIAKLMVYDDLRLPNYKLGTVCEAFDVELKAHDAMEDVRATRKIFYYINTED
jgi:DNA polymerase-3 subunit epsilon